jgi:putative solute:sodium symporter small subunit
MSEQFSRAAYWKANLKLMALCLSIWFVVSYLFGIVLVDQLNAISIGGYDLGFWFAQQGSMYVFVVLIFFYAARMNKLDKQFDVHED